MRVFVCVCVYTYIHTCIHSSQYSEACQAKEIKKELGQQWMPQAKEIFLRAILDTRP